MEVSIKGTPLEIAVLVGYLQERRQDNYSIDAEVIEDVKHSFQDHIERLATHDKAEEE